MTATEAAAPNPPAEPRDSGGRFPAIDGLRAIAAISVVTYHVVLNYDVESAASSAGAWTARLGNFGVSTFFLISGLLLYRPFVMAHFRDQPHPSYRPFWIRRFTRIFPAYWIALTGALWLGIHELNDLGDFFTRYLLLGNYRYGYSLSGLGVEWTLVIEVSFYLALPFLARGIGLLSPRGAPLARKLRGEFAGLAILYGLAMAVRVWYLWFFDLPAATFGQWFSPRQLTGWLIGYLDWFALGMLLAVGSAWVANGGRLPWVARALARNPLVCWLLALQCYWISVQLNLPANPFEVLTRIQSFGLTFVFGAIAFLMLFPTVFGDQSQGNARRFLRSPVMHWLGTVSYGIYLWHIVFVNEIEKRTLAGDFSGNVFVWWITVMALTVPTAALSYYLLEKPLIGLAHRNTRGGPRRPLDQPRFGPRRRELRAFVELLGLCGIAFTHPTLDILAKNTSVFITSGATGLQTILLVVVIALVPATIAYGVEVAIGLVAPRGRAGIHALLAGLLVAVVVVEAFQRYTELGDAVLVGAAIAVGIGALVLVLRTEPARQFLRFLAIGTPLFCLMFLGLSPVTDVVFKDPDAVAASVGIENPKRVVVVVLDELPLQSLIDTEGTIDRTLFPNLAALADTSTWYRNETTIAPYTQLAVPAILTGETPPRADALPSTSDYPDSLFTLLAGSYSMNVHEAVTRLCPTNTCGTQAEDGGLFGLVRQSASLWTDFIAPPDDAFTFNETSGTATALRTARQFIASLAPAEEPRLDFVHIELPHQPWHYISTLQDTTETGPPPGAEFLSWSDQQAAEMAQRRHLQQTQAADTLVGRIVTKLQRLGEFDDALVIVTADHGVAFNAGDPIRSVSADNYTDIMWTPLIVHYPGQASGEVDDRAALSIDVLPTIADVIDAEVPWEVDGRSLLGDARTDDRRPLYQWGDNAYEPPDTLRPGADEQHLTFDGAEGFATALANPALTGDLSDPYRLYRVGDHADLIGTDAEPLVQDRDGPETTGLVHQDAFDDVQPNARTAPWAYASGLIRDFTNDRPVAFSVDGTIAAVSEAGSLEGTGHGFFQFVIPPTLVHEGRNEIVMYFIDGEPGDVTLDPIPWYEPSG